MNNSSTEGIFNGQKYKIAYGEIDGYMHMIAKWNGRVLHDEEDGLYSMFSPLNYLDCKLSYLECLRSNDPKSCFSKHGYEIIQKCHSFMSETNNINIYKQ